MDREKVIEGLETMREFFGFGLQSQAPVFEAYQNILTDALALLKEQEDIKELFVEAFNTIRDAYNTPANREKILLNYLLRNACCCADGERQEDDD